MAFRNIKSKVKAVEVSRMYKSLTAVPETKMQDNLDPEISMLQLEAKNNEETWNLSIKSCLATSDDNIDDVKASIDERRPGEDEHSPSMCDVWLRLKAAEQWEPSKIVPLLRLYQLHQPRTRNSVTKTDDDEVDELKHLTIIKHRSRLAHLHICEGSDEFNCEIDSYIGFMVFSYENHAKFKLNGHHCQRGDIVIKRTSTLKNIRNRRGKYDALFKWYFDRWIDERFLGMGFSCIDGKCCFEPITYNNHEMSPYECRILDMFLLTQWLTTETLVGSARSVQEMEKNAQKLLFKQHSQTARTLTDRKQSVLAPVWNQIVGGDTDLSSAIVSFNAIAWKQIETLYSDSADVKKSSIGAILTELLAKRRAPIL